MTTQFTPPSLFDTKAQGDILASLREHIITRSPWDGRITDTLHISLSALATYLSEERERQDTNGKESIFPTGDRLTIEAKQKYDLDREVGEPDEDLRERMRAVFDRPSLGSNLALIEIVKDAVVGVKDVRFVRGVGNAFNVYVVSSIDPPGMPDAATYPGTATAELRTAVLAALVASTRNPSGYTYMAPELLAVGYTIAATVYYFPTDDIAEVQNRVREAAYKFIDDRLILGRHVHQSQIIEALHVEGVDYLSLNLIPAGQTDGVSTIVIADNAFGSCRQDDTDVNLTFTERVT